MKQPPIARVYYDSSKPRGERISVDLNPIPVSPGLRTLVWLREESMENPWRFNEIRFKRSTIFRNVIVQDRVVTAVDDNTSDENRGTIEYTICIVDETTGEVVCKDPQIDNEIN